MAKDLTAIRIPGDLIEALKRISAQPGSFYSERTTSWLIVQAVKEFIERKDSEEPKRKGKGYPPRKESRKGHKAIRET